MDAYVCAFNYYFTSYNNPKVRCVFFASTLARLSGSSHLIRKKYCQAECNKRVESIDILLAHNQGINIDFHYVTNKKKWFYFSVSHRNSKQREKATRTHQMASSVYFLLANFSGADILPSHFKRILKMMKRIYIWASVHCPLLSVIYFRYWVMVDR